MQLRPQEPPDSSLGIPLDPSRPFPNFELRPDVIQQRGVSVGLLVHIYLQVIAEYWMEQGVQTIQMIDFIPSESFERLGMMISPRFPLVPFFSSWSLPWGIIQAMDETVQAGDEETYRRDLTRYEMLKRNPPHEVVGAFTVTIDPAASNANPIGLDESSVALKPVPLNATDGTNPTRTSSNDMSFDSDWTGVRMSIKDVLFVVKDMSKEMWIHVAREALRQIPPPITLQRDPSDRNSAWITLQVLDIGPDTEALNYIDLADALRRILANHVVTDRFESMRHFLIDSAGTRVARFEYSKGRPRATVETNEDTPAITSF